MAGQKLSLSSGVVTVDTDGCIEVEDKAVAVALQNSGFKPAFARKAEAKVEAKAEVKEEPVAEESKPEPLSTSKVDHNQKKKGK